MNKSEVVKHITNPYFHTKLAVILTVDPLRLLMKRNALRHFFTKNIFKLC